MNRLPEAFRSAELFDSGAGYLVVSRFKTDGRVESGFFLLDVFCLGVKDADFHCFTSIADYQKSLLDRLFPHRDPVPITPAAARKLTEEAINYAKRLGFSPAADCKKACRVFGGITAAGCHEEFTFGKDGKPLYIQWPSDPPERVEKILRALEARCGEGGYDYFVDADNFESLDAEEENSECAIAGPVGRAGLEEMTTGLRDSHSSFELRINPVAPRKVSDMLARVAEPLLEFASDFETKQVVLSVAALAWNFTLLDPTTQEEMLPELADLFQSRDGVQIFFYLAVRKLLLFPEVQRFICNAETVPRAHRNVTLRVVSTS